MDGEKWVHDVFTLDLDEQQPVWEVIDAKGVPVSFEFHHSVNLGGVILVYSENSRENNGKVHLFDTTTFCWETPKLVPQKTLAKRESCALALNGTEVYIYGGGIETKTIDELHVLETAGLASLNRDLKVAWELPWHDAKLVTNNSECRIHLVMLKGRCPRLYEHFAGEISCARATGTVPSLYFGDCDESSLVEFCNQLYGRKSRNDFALLDEQFESLVREIKEDVFTFSQKDNQRNHTSYNEAFKSKTGEFSDIQMIVEGEQYSLHRVILAARSPYFAAMLKCELKEAHSDSIVLSKLKKESFEVILD